MPNDEKKSCQFIILTVFVLGLIDLMAYSETIVAIAAMPEFAPGIIAVLIVLGVVIYLRRRKKIGRKSS